MDLTKFLNSWLLLAGIFLVSCSFPQYSNNIPVKVVKGRIIKVKIQDQDFWIQESLESFIRDCIETENIDLLALGTDENSLTSEEIDSTGRKVIKTPTVSEMYYAINAAGWDDSQIGINFCIEPNGTVALSRYEDGNVDRTNPSIMRLEKLMFKYQYEPDSTKCLHCSKFSFATKK